MKLILYLVLGGLMATFNDNLCFFQLPDGTSVCRACDDPPELFISSTPAPDDTPIDVLPESGAEPYRMPGGDNK